MTAICHVTRTGLICHASIGLGGTIYSGRGITERQARRRLANQIAHAGLNRHAHVIRTGRWVA